MRQILLLTLLYWTANTYAYVVSPDATEVKFSYTAEFQTQSKDPAEKLIERHAEFLFGYLQSPKLVADFGINQRTPGIGAPAWPVDLSLNSDQVDADGMRTLSYRLNGTMLFNKAAAKPLLRAGEYEIIMPYDLDNYYEFECSDWGDENSARYFWYFYNPFHKDCEKLIEAPLAHPVSVKISQLPEGPEHSRAPLKVLRGDNGNGDLFDIVTVNGFDIKSDPSDSGRVAYDDINAWLRGSGFDETVVSRHANRPVYQYDKTVKSRSGEMVHIRVTRLLADTALLNDNVTFAKFFKSAIQSADVFIYAGHSGKDVVFDMADVEKRAGAVEFNAEKQQLFFFDACSGYSYYMSVFDGKKDPGTLSVLSHGLPTMFGFEHAMHKALLRYLFDMKEDQPEWNAIVTDMNKSLRGMTFLLNLKSN